MGKIHKIPFLSYCSELFRAEKNHNLAFLREVRYHRGERTVDDLTVLYEDGALLVCVKPRGVLSAKDASGKPSVTDDLPPVYPVHRLDREVTGLMVFAKTAEAAAFLSAAMGNGFCKEYLALAEHAPAPTAGEMVDLLFHDRHKNKTYVVKRPRGGVKEARLAYRVLQTAPDGRALLHIRLFTGRTHQIRVQLASRGCPLCGDRKYGAKSGGEIALFAWRLRFPHPDGGERCFTLPQSLLPPEFSLVKLPEM